MVPLGSIPDWSSQPSVLEQVSTAPSSRVSGEAEQCSGCCDGVGCMSETEPNHLASGPARGDRVRLGSRTGPPPLVAPRPDGRLGRGLSGCAATSRKTLWLLLGVCRPATGDPTSRGILSHLDRDLEPARPYHGPQTGPPICARRLQAAARRPMCVCEVPTSPAHEEPILAVACRVGDHVIRFIAADHHQPRNGRQLESRAGELDPSGAKRRTLRRVVDLPYAGGQGEKEAEDCRQSHRHGNVMRWVMQSPYHGSSRFSRSSVTCRGQVADGETSGHDGRLQALPDVDPGHGEVAPRCSGLWRAVRCTPVPSSAARRVSQRVRSTRRR